jgi:Protein O-mannosyl-transferase TMEM260-like
VEGRNYAMNDSETHINQLLMEDYGRRKAGLQKFRKNVNPHLTLVPVVLAVLPLLVHYFEWFPNGWDQTEYVWCLRSTYLPHSPYVLFFLVGKLFYLFFDAPIALTTLSLLSGVGSLALLYFVSYRLFSLEQAESRLPHVAALIVAAVAGATYVFVRQSSSQEVYALLTFMLLLTIALSLSALRYNAALSGVSFGCALGAHTAAIYAVPVVLYTILFLERKGRLKSLVIWGLAATTTCAVLCMVILLILPIKPGVSRWRDYLAYLRGISPGLSPSAWAEPVFWIDSLKGLYLRLTSLQIESSRMPMATSPLGLGLLHGFIAAAGMVVSLVRRRRLAWFCLAWMGPYLLFEIALGQNVDYGVYLPLLLPPLSILIGTAVASMAGRTATSSMRPVIGAARASLVVILLWPSAVLYVQHWNDPTEDAIAHFSASTLAAIWASERLPGDALVIQPESEWNVNILPYYSKRQHVLRSGADFRIFQSLGRYTPMNSDSYQTLTTSLLIGIIRSGRPVYAWEKDPLKGSVPHVLNPRAFVWVGDTYVDLRAVKLPSVMPAAVRLRMPDGSVVLYRGLLNE